MKLGHRRKDHNWRAVWRIFAKTKPAPPLVCGVSGARQQIYLEPGPDVWAGAGAGLDSVYSRFIGFCLNLFLQKKVMSILSRCGGGIYHLPSACLESTIHSPSLQLFMQSVFKFTFMSALQRQSLWWCISMYVSILRQNWFKCPNFQL